MADDRESPLDRDALLLRIDETVTQIRVGCGACQERLESQGADIAQHESLLRGIPGDDTSHGLDVRVDRLEGFQRRLIAYVAAAPAAIAGAVSGLLVPLIKGFVALFRG